MLDANHIRQVYERYPELVTKGDVDTIVALYTEDAIIEDPIGSELHRGRDAVRAFYQAAAGTVVMKRTGPVRVAGSEAATPLVVLIGPEGQQQALDIISVMTFDDAGLVQSMRAFWSMDTMRPATAEDLAL
jgi:steroid delta-isomerase